MPSGQGLHRGVQLERGMQREKSDGNPSHQKEEELVMAPGHLALRTNYSEEACHLAAFLFSLVKMISACLHVLFCFVFFFNPIVFLKIFDASCFSTSSCSLPLKHCGRLQTPLIFFLEVVFCSRERGLHIRISFHLSLC